MKRRTQDLLLAVRISSDMLMVTIGWVLSYALRFSGLLPTPKGIPDWALYLKLLPFIVVIWLGVFAVCGFYRRAGRYRSAFIEALDILQGCVLATLAFIAFTYLYEEYRYSRGTMVIFALLHPWLVITGRSAIRKILRRYRRRSQPRRTLFIGSGDILQQALELNFDSDLSRGEISGVMSVGEGEQLEKTKSFLAQRQLQDLALPSDWADFFTRHPVESVIIALPHRQYGFIETHLDRIADQVSDVKIIPDLVRYTRFAAAVEVVSGAPVITVNDSPLEGLGAVFKRGVDILGALVALSLFGPIMVVLAILVKFSSPGPIFYRQERMGLDGHTFDMFKFRSMPVGAEASTGAVWARPNDDRPTFAGRWLRRTSLDELPQFFNVLRGDMSLVGPRPERPVFVEQFRKQVPGYYLRHKTKAGITGWAQVNGWRGNTSIEKRIECDLFYIQNWSLWFDIRIILLTVIRGFINKNAY